MGELANRKVEISRLFEVRTTAYPEVDGIVNELRLSRHVPVRPYHELIEDYIQLPNSERRTLEVFVDRLITEEEVEKLKTEVGKLGTSVKSVSDLPSQLIIEEVSVPIGREVLSYERTKRKP